MCPGPGAAASPGAEQRELTSCAPMLLPTLLTREHCEDRSEGIELEPVYDAAGVDELKTHEAEADHQQQDVEHLGDHRQPQHP